MNNSSIINPVLPKGCVANCIWPGLVWSVALIREGGPNLGGLESRQNVATIQATPKGLLSLLYITMRDRYTFRVAVQERNFIRGRRGTCTLWRLQRVPMTRRLQPTPFKAAKNLLPQFCVVFLMHASSSMLGRSPMDCCDQCQFPLLGPVLRPVLGAVLGPVLGTTIRIERTGAKTEAKIGLKSGPKSGTNFAKLSAHFFRACGESLPAMELPMFCNFRLFLVRAHPCTHSATANSS